MNPVRLRGRAVAKRFGRIAALRGVDLEIAPGEAVSILGANGAGKSTLLRILAGLARPSDGRLEAIRESEATAPIVLRREALRRDVGYVGHASLVYGELTARENLAFAARLQGVSTTAVRLDALLDQVGLAALAPRRAATLSRGLLQRLAIARALVHDPSVLLFDEPFTGLDEISADRLVAMLQGLRSRGTTLIVVTHDPVRAVALSSRALVLSEGRIVAESSRSAEAGAGASEVPFTADALREVMRAHARMAAAG